MSLDVMLYRTYHVSYDKGETLEKREECVYDSNITHNLGRMANKAGIYEALWRPYQLKKEYNIDKDDYESEYEFEQNNTVIAEDIISIIEIGLDKLKTEPEYFKKFDSENGWGIYDHFVPFVEEYLEALKKYPKSTVKISR